MLGESEQQSQQQQQPAIAQPPPPPVQDRVVTGQQVQPPPQTGQPQQQQQLNVNSNVFGGGANILSPVLPPAAGEEADILSPVGVFCGYYL